jgi:hypothetical protein
MLKVLLKMSIQKRGYKIATSDNTVYAARYAHPNCSAIAPQLRIHRERYMKCQSPQLSQLEGNEQYVQSI